MENPLFLVRLLLNASITLFIIGSIFSIVPGSRGANRKTTQSPSRLASRPPAFLCGSITQQPAGSDDGLMALSEELYRLDQTHYAARRNVHWTVNTESDNQKLFTSMDETVFTKRIYAKLIAILDNYQDPMGRAPFNTRQQDEQQLAQQSDFLDEVLGSVVMRKAWNFLATRGHVSTDFYEFKKCLNRLWFTVPDRDDGWLGISGFHHVFVGKVNGTRADSPMSGLHNWVRYYREEKAGRLEYVRTKSRTHPDMFGLQFKWNGHLKLKGTIAMGESPAMSMAVMTTCLLVAPNQKCQLRMDGTSVWVKTFRRDTLKPGVFHLRTAYYL